MAARKKARKKTGKKSADQLGAKAQFIRQHPNLSAKELIEAAAKRGLTIRTPQVYKIRAAKAPQSGQGGGPRPRGSVADHAQPGSSDKLQSKSEFIRTRPPGMTARQVVQAAAALGMSLSEHFVYNIRSTAKKKARGVVGRASAAGGPGRPAPGRLGTREAQFRRLAMELGLQRSSQLLEELEHRLTALIAGQS
jgi:hypothetical protein